MIVGDGKFKYELDENWPKSIPEYWNLGQCADVDIDKNDDVWVFSRGLHPVTKWSNDGNFIGSWGYKGDKKGEFKVAHGLNIDDEGFIWLTDHQTHQVTKHKPNGECILELGEFGFANFTLTTDGTLGNPFNMPTGSSIAPDGKIFVSDGYGNRRVHRFSKEGKHEISWGEHGTSEGKFSIVHKLGVSKDNRVFVCDRENDRIQIFSTDGELLEIWTNGLIGPGDVYFQDDIVYVVEQGGGNGMSIWNLNGDLITRWRGVPEVCEAAHGCAVDSKGNIFIAEIGEGFVGQRIRKLNKI
jgi:DNA-binding beta-propeller fold protein YncE